MRPGRPSLVIGCLGESIRMDRCLYDCFRMHGVEAECLESREETREAAAGVSLDVVL